MAESTDEKLRADPGRTMIRFCKVMTVLALLALAFLMAMNTAVWMGWWK